MPTPNDIPHPSEWPAVERESRLIDALLDVLRTHKDPEDTRSVVEVIADGAGVEMLALPEDPMELAEFLGGRWVTALMDAGTDHASRIRCVRMAVGHLRELLEVIEYWEEKEGTTVLQQARRGGGGGPILTPEYGPAKRALLP